MNGSRNEVLEVCHRVPFRLRRECREVHRPGGVLGDTRRIHTLSHQLAHDLPLR